MVVTLEKFSCARKNSGAERRDYFAELSVWALERLGELLRAMPKQHGARGTGSNQHAKVEARNELPPLADLIERNTATRSQKIAAAGKPVIADYIADCRSRGKEITKAGALAAAKRHLREQSLKNREAEPLPPGPLKP